MLLSKHFVSSADRNVSTVCKNVLTVGFLLILLSFCESGYMLGPVSRVLEHSDLRSCVQPAVTLPLGSLLPHPLAELNHEERQR